MKGILSFISRLQLVGLETPIFLQLGEGWWLTGWQRRCLPNIIHLFKQGKTLSSSWNRAEHYLKIPIWFCSLLIFLFKQGFNTWWLWAPLTPLPDQIQLKVFVTDRVKLPTSFIPKKDRLWLKTKKIQRAFFEKSLFCVFSPIFTRPHWDKRSYGPDVALKGPKWP